MLEWNNAITIGTTKHVNSKGSLHFAQALSHHAQTWWEPALRSAHSGCDAFWTPALECQFRMSVEKLILRVFLLTAQPKIDAAKKSEIHVLSAKTMPLMYSVPKLCHSCTQYQNYAIHVLSTKTTPFMWPESSCDISTVHDGRDLSKVYWLI